MKRSFFVLLSLAFLCGSARADLAGDIRAILRDKYLNKIDIGRDNVTRSTVSWRSMA